MPVLKFCDEGQLIASIIIEGVEYITNNPPLTIEYGFSSFFYAYTKYALNYEFFFLPENYPTNNFTWNFQEVTYIDDYNSTGFFRIFYEGIEVFNSGVIPVYNYGLDQSSGINNSNNYLFRVSDSNRVIYTDNKETIYKIKCDGCKPGECKGKQSKYPGYVCLDCKKMKQGLLNIRSKLNEFK